MIFHVNSLHDFSIFIPMEIYILTKYIENYYYMNMNYLILIFYIYHKRHTYNIIMLIYKSYEYLFHTL